MDFGKYQYQEQKRAREAKKHQKVIEVKEIKFRPKVDEHDYQFKKKHIERFLEDGDKVKATIFFRGREMAHPEIGRRILERLIEELAEVAIAETMPRQEGNQMHTILAQRAGREERRRRREARQRRDRATRERVAKRRNDVTRRRSMPKLKTHRAPRSGSRRPEREVPAQQGVQAAHPDEQDDEAQAPAARHDDGRPTPTRRSCADAAVQVELTELAAGSFEVGKRERRGTDVRGLRA